MNAKIKKMLSKLEFVKSGIVGAVALIARYIPFKKIDMGFLGKSDAMSISQLREGCSMVGGLVEGCNLIKFSNFILLTVGLVLIALFVYKNYKAIHETIKAL